MPVKIEVCSNIDFTPCLPDNPQPPICKLGHGWSSDCLKSNDCSDYKPSSGYSLEEVRKKFGVKGG